MRAQVVFEQLLVAVVAGEMFDADAMLAGC
jgi:hypothetical protein